MSIRKTHGITLIETLVVLAIAVIVLLQGNLGGYNRARETRLIDGVMTDLVSAISMARQSAIFEAQMVTICRSSDGLHCQGKWHDGSIIFTDRNADREINGTDRLLFRLEPSAALGTLSFTSFRNRQYLQMTPRGMTNYQNGNFTFCPASGDPTQNRQLIVSISGRTRMARDRDGDGIVENSQGNPVLCD